MIELRPLPNGWPRGWWLAQTVLFCCSKGTLKGHKIQPGDPVYLTGEDGTCFCTKHAPEPLPSDDAA